MPIEHFHPAVAAWFSSSFPAPTPAQLSAWPAIQAGRHTLIAAPTGSGKTLAAFLAVIDELVRRGVAQSLAQATQVVYVSPLKALSNDIRCNLEQPLAGIREALRQAQDVDVDIQVLVRTGDTPASERARMRKHPPHIVVTTPESLYILLTSESGRRMLATTRTVIIDEIHALVSNKRGSHLALSLERLAALTGAPLRRIGLSATQKPLAEVARFLVGSPATGAAMHDCAIVDAGYSRVRDLALEVPAAPLEAVMSNDVWQQVYDRLAQLIDQHRSTLVFVNTRRMAERVARHLSERVGENHVTAHHGSLAREQRLDAEQRLKRGELKALVATASLELGIDIGSVDLVCQIGSPRSIATLLQRVGRAGHAVGGVPKGRVFPLSRDELVECTALLDAVERQELDCLKLPQQPLDVLAQQIVAEVACREYTEDELFALVGRAYPYRCLQREDFQAVVHMLAEGVATNRGRRSAHLHRDAVNKRLRGRRGARLAAITAGGTIPDNADYRVVLEPEDQFIGTLNEDFAVESLAGDIFQLGNAAYRILRVETGCVRVEDAKGQPPNMPFWLGEAPARSDELSYAVARLRAECGARLDNTPASRTAAQAALTQQVGLSAAAAAQVVDYLAAAKAALGLLPTQTDIIAERFFDESGGTQLVIHSPYGNRINRAWGLSLRKRFCRQFNFELQAAATDDAIILSLTSVHSFPLVEIGRYLHSHSVRQVLIQALLDAPMFMTRWRWNATIALAMARFRAGKKVPAQLQRMDAEDLVAAVFPEQLACQENIVGDRQIPDHPLVQQTLTDCLTEAMDIDGLERLLAAMEAGQIRLIGVELTEPSPLAAEILTARPYAYLDDAPLEERRTQAVMSRRWLDPETAADLGKLDSEAIQRVRAEAWPEASNADELHDALFSLSFLSAAEVDAQPGWCQWMAVLAAERRVTRWQLPQADGRPEVTSDCVVWLAAERLPEFQAVFPGERPALPIIVPAEFAGRAWSSEEALTEILRGRLEGLGPATASALAASLRLPQQPIDAALIRLQSQGFVMSGQFTNATTELEWCERRLLARIHRYTVHRLRREIEPVASRDFMRFLLAWQHVVPGEQVEGPDALGPLIAQLEGFEAPAAAWETEILPARVKAYQLDWLDDLCLAGRCVWTRLGVYKPAADNARGSGPLRTTPIVLLARRHARLWTALADKEPTAMPLTARAQTVADYLSVHGASFFDELVEGSGLLRAEIEEALAELVAFGLVNADSFSGLRALLVPADRRPSARSGKSRRRTALFGLEDAGRWTLLRRSKTTDNADERTATAGDPQQLVHIALTLLKRYGVVFWRLLSREAAWLPPWRDLLKIYRRLEARGDIRGGRFVAGFSGEQFALPGAVGMLRKLRNQPDNGCLVSISAADPLNLVGILTPGAKVSALTANRILYRDGVALAVRAGGEVRFLADIAAEAEWEAKNTLLKRQVPALLNYLR